MNEQNRLHITTGRWRLGLCLSLVSALLWGILPIVLKSLLGCMDGYTITCCRFLFAAVLLSIFVIAANRLPSAAEMRGPVIWLLAVATAGLCGNYVLFIIGLKYLSPSTTAVLGQTATIFMLLGGLVVFKERFDRRQWVGFAVLVLGMGLFFNERLDELLFGLGNYTAGVLLVVLGALVWSIYALAQKQLLRTLRSETVLMILYSVSGLLLLPVARLGQVAQLQTHQLWLLVFCAVNTLVAYGSLAEALNHLEASRVSMVLATIPLITMAATKFCAVVLPGLVRADQLNGPGIAGALLVVAGSALCALSRADKGKTPQA